MQHLATGNRNRPIGSSRYALGSRRLAMRAQCLRPAVLAAACDYMQASSSWVSQPCCHPGRGGCHCQSSDERLVSEACQTFDTYRYDPCMNKAARSLAGRPPPWQSTHPAFCKHERDQHTAATIVRSSTTHTRRCTLALACAHGLAQSACVSIVSRHVRAQTLVPCSANSVLLHGSRPPRSHTVSCMQARMHSGG
jgi:hypothetical protein